MDGARALTFATPALRDQFGVGGSFHADGPRRICAAACRARHENSWEGAVIEGAVIQPLRLILPDNTVLVAISTRWKNRRTATGKLPVASSRRRRFRPPDPLARSTVTATRCCFAIGRLALQAPLPRLQCAFAGGSVGHFECGRQRVGLRSARECPLLQLPDTCARGFGFGG